MKDRTTIPLEKETRKRLKKAASKAQSYDEFINQLLEFHDKYKYHHLEEVVNMRLEDLQ